MLMKMENTLTTFPLGIAQEGQWVKIVDVAGEKSTAKRLIALGMMEGIKVQVLQRSKGAGVVITCGETRLALGMSMAYQIMVTPHPA